MAAASRLYDSIIANNPPAVVTYELMIPPLLNTEWVSGNTSRLLDITLRGLHSPIEVNKARYHGEMSGFKQLKDEEISDILNFIRTDFGKVSGKIIPPTCITSVRD